MSEPWKIKHGWFVGSNYKVDRHLTVQKRKVYRCWRSMKSRCYDVKHKSYARYGGRGITVCEEWKNDFLQFLKDMNYPPTAKHSIERKNNKLGYEPDNCIWSLPMEQMQNRECVKRWEINGSLLSAADMARIVGITTTGMHHRIKHHPQTQWLSMDTKRGQKKHAS